MANYTPNPHSNISLMVLLPTKKVGQHFLFHIHHVSVFRKPMKKPLQDVIKKKQSVVCSCYRYTEHDHR